MKKAFFLTLLFASLTIHAQINRFYYHLTMKFDSALVQRDLTVLEVDKDKNLFYSNEYLRTDSINKSTNKFRFAYPNFKNILIWKKRENSFNFKKNVSGSYYEYNKKVEIDWHLLNETKKIGNYSAQKAEGKYGGRIWTAWFTTEIPFAYGPYVFYGLPGLVLEVYDNADDYHFSFIQNKVLNTDENTEQLLEKYLGRKKFTIKPSEWKQVQLNFYNNPIPEYKNGNAMMLKDDGSQYSSDDYRELEKSIKRNIRRYNNPIELDEKIYYQ